MSALLPPLSVFKKAVQCGLWALSVLALPGSAEAEENRTLIQIPPESTQISWALLPGLPPQQDIPAPTTTEDFGAAVAISGDWAVVGAPAWSSPPSHNVGRVHVFSRGIDGIWSIVQTLTPPQLAANGRFGAAVALQGSRLLISQPGIADGETHVGLVHAYVLAPMFGIGGLIKEIWTDHQVLRSLAPQEDPATGLARYFGDKIAMDGDSLAISEALRDPQGPVNRTLWEVATFRWDNNGGTVPGNGYLWPPIPWQPDTQLTGLTKYPILGGISVSLKGSTLAVANCEHLSPEGWRTGAVTLFQKTIAGWNRQQVLTPPKDSPSSSFGDRLLLLENSVLIGEFDGVREYRREGDAWQRGNLMSQKRVTSYSSLPQSVEPAAAHGDFVLALGDSHPYLYHRQQDQLQVLRKFDPYYIRLRCALSGDTAMAAGVHLGFYQRVSFFVLKDFVVYPGSPPDAYPLMPDEALPAWKPLTAAETYPITLRNTGITPIALPYAFLNGVNKEAFAISSDGPATLQPGEEAVYHLRMVNGLQYTDTNLRIHFDRLLPNVSGNSYPLLIPATMNSVPEVPDITHLDTAYIIPLGEAFQLNPTVVGKGPYAYQWSLNGAPIAGQTNRILPLPTVTAADAGTYSLTVTFARRQLTSVPVDLVVYDYRSGVLPIRPDQSAKMTARFWGKAQIHWSSTVSTWHDNWGLQGVNSATLTLTSGYLLAEDTVFTAYLLAGDPEYGHAIAEIATYSVPLLLRPAITQALSGSFEPNQVLYDTAVVGTGRSSSSLPGDGFRYSAKGLPPGLQLDALTGIVSGVFTRAGDYRVTWTLQDAFGGVSAPFVTSIHVGPPRIQHVGLFCSLMDGAIPAYATGGHIQVMISPGGGVSGTLRMGVSSAPFAGRFITDPNDPESYIAPISLPALPGTRKTRILLAQYGDGRFEAYLIMTPPGGDEEWSINTLSAAMTFTAREREAYHGRYTSFLNVAGAEDDPAMPQGSGYMSISIGAAIAQSAPQTAGRASGNSPPVVHPVNVVGALPDGTRFTASAPMICEGFNVLLYYCAGAPRVSLKGSFMLEERDQISLYNSFEWSSAPNPRSRNYPQGIRAELWGNGARYFPPLKGQYLVPDVVDAPDNARLTLSSGGLDAAAVGAPWKTLLHLTTKHTVLLPAGAPEGRVTSLKFNAATGVFTGQFELTDPASPAAVKRTAPFSGLVAPHLYRASGLFLLPQLPDPSATPPTTSATSPILSGSVLLTAPYLEAAEPED